MKDSFPAGQPECPMDLESVTRVLRDIVVGFQKEEINEVVCVNGTTIILNSKHVQSIIIDSDDSERIALREITARSCTDFVVYIEGEVIYGEDYSSRKKSELSPDDGFRLVLFSRLVELIPRAIEIAKEKKRRRAEAVEVNRKRVQENLKNITDASSSTESSIPAIRVVAQREKEAAEGRLETEMRLLKKRLLGLLPEGN